MGDRPERTCESAEATISASGHMLRVSRPSIRGNTALAYDYALEPEPELIEIPVEQRKNLLQLTDATCHWPVGDPGSSDFFFCGGESNEGSPYCNFHSRVAYQPASERRRERQQRSAFRSGHGH